MQPYSKPSSPDQGASFMSFCFHPATSENFPSLITFKGESDAFCVPILCALACYRVALEGNNGIINYQVPGNSCQRRSSLSLKYNKCCLVVTQNPMKNLHLSANWIRGYYSILPALQEVHGKKCLPQQVSVNRITQKTIKNSYAF